MIRSRFRISFRLLTATIAAIAPILCSSGCGSFSNSSKSISKSISSPINSSSRSSRSENYKDQVRDFTTAYMKSGGDVSQLKAQLSSVAEKNGVTDWESDQATYEGIGAGFARAGVKPAELEAYKVTIATTEEQAQWMQDGYDSGK